MRLLSQISVRRHQCSLRFLSKVEIQEGQSFKLAQQASPFLHFTTQRYNNNDSGFFGGSHSIRSSRPENDHQRILETSQRFKRRSDYDLEQAIRDCRSVRDIVILCIKEESNMQTFHISTCWCQVSRCLSKNKKELKENPGLLNHLLTLTVETCDKMGSRSLSTTSHRMAKIGLASELEVWNAVEKKAVELTAHDSKDISNILWAFAKVGRKSPVLFDHFSNLDITHMDTFNSQDISNTVWSFARVDHRSPVIFAAAADEAIKKLETFTPQAISNTIRSYVLVRHTSPKLFDVMAGEAVKKMSTFTPQNTCLTLWSYATVGHSSPALFDAAAREAAKNMYKFTPQYLCNTLWSFAKLRHRSPELFDAAALECIQKINQFSSRHISNTLWSYATLNHPSPELFQAATQQLSKDLSSFNEQNLTSLLWSLAVMDCEVESAVLVLNHILDCHKSKKLRFSNMNRRQLHQANLWVAMEHEKGSPIPDDLADEWRHAFTTPQGRTPSKFRTNVISTFQSLDDYDVLERIICEQTGYNIDVIVDKKNGAEIAIEVNGPPRYVERDLPTGSTVLKQRQLSNHPGGRPLLSVPHWNWNELGNQAEQQDFLLTEIKKLLSKVL